MSFFVFITLLKEALSARSKPGALGDNPVLVFAYGLLLLLAIMATAVIVLAIAARLFD